MPLSLVLNGILCLNNVFVKVRNAVITDIDKIIELRLMNAQYHADLVLKTGLRSGILSFFTNHTYKIINDNNFKISVGVKNDCIVAYAIGCIGQEHPIFDYGKQGLIDDVFVIKELRALGYGQILVNELMEWFQDNKTERVDLNVYQLNSRAASFWEKQGFQVLFKRMTKKI